MAIALGFLLGFLVFALRKWWINYCLYMGALAYITENKLREPSADEMAEHVAYVAKRTIDDLFGNLK